MWRSKMTNKLNIVSDNSSVSITPYSLSNSILDDYANASIDIWFGKDHIFKNKEDALLFAEIIVKLLNVVGENDDIE